jgi:hypothetical protein
MLSDQVVDSYGKGRPIPSYRMRVSGAHGRGPWPGAPSLCPERELRLRVQRSVARQSSPCKCKGECEGERERDTRPARTERSGVKRNPLFLPTSHHCSLHFTSPIPSINPPPSLPFPLPCASHNPHPSSARNTNSTVADHRRRRCDGDGASLRCSGLKQPAQGPGDSWVINTYSSITRF